MARRALDHLIPVGPLALAVTFVTGLASPVRAQWTQTGDPVCTEAHNQSSLTAVPTPDGGIIVIWSDSRGASEDIYAQKLDSTGVAQWATNGVPVCTAAGGQYTPVAIPDQTGGAIVVWNDNRNSSSDIYAQRIDSSGAPLWTPDGVPVCDNDQSQSVIQVIPDGVYPLPFVAHPGAIIMWNDSRNHPDSGNDLYMQRIDGTGALSWSGGTSGVALSQAPGNQDDAVLCPDGSGKGRFVTGSFVAWRDARTGFTDIYAKHVTGAGAPQWAPDGVSVCTAPGNHTFPCICYAGGNAFIAWGDNRTATSHIFAQQLDVNGTAQWVTDGVPVCEEAGGQSLPIAVPIGGGEVIVAWSDQRNGTNNQDIYAQRMSATGSRLWPTAGVPIATAIGNQNGASIVGDGAGGAILCWLDDRSGAAYEVYAQRIDIDGNILWQPDGVRLCSVTGIKYQPALVSDEAYGAIAAWNDLRSGTNFDVYANRVKGGHGTVNVFEGPITAFRVAMLSSNPAHGEMRFALDVPRQSPARAEVFDLAGRRLRTLVNDPALPAGSHVLSWDGRDGAGVVARAGIYLVRVRAGSASRTLRVVEVR